MSNLDDFPGPATTPPPAQPSGNSLFSDAEQGWIKPTSAQRTTRSGIRVLLAQLTQRATLLSLCGGVVLIFAFAISAWLYLRSGKHFPALPSGSYIGELKGVFEEQPHVSFYVERAPENQDLFIAVLKPGWTPQIRSTAFFAGGPAGSSALGEWHLPLLISQGQYQIELSGTQDSSGDYRGIARELSSGREGSWQLAPIRSPPSDVERAAGNIRLWLMLMTEREEVEARIGEAELRIPAQRAEMEKLSKLLTEGQELRERANEKYALVRSELSEASKELEKERKEVRKLESALDISQKVTPSGRLVGLARESLEREARIVDSLLRSSTGTSSSDLEEQYLSAEEALSLQRRILEARAASVRGMPRLTRQSPARSSR